MGRIVLPRRVSARGITRREALRTISVAAGATALAPWAIGCGDDGHPAATPTATATSASSATATHTPTVTPTATHSATPSPSATATPSPLVPEELEIETVIILMMENRSFDHYYGSLSLEEGRAVNGLMAGMRNPLPDGTPVDIFPMDLRCVADPPHGWFASRGQVNNGANDGFVREHYDDLPDNMKAAAAQVMGYLRRANIPISYALADEFVLCQQWYCSVLGPTWPNRFFLHSAQSNGRINNDPPADLTVGFTWPTIYDRLNQAGIEWTSYFGDLPFLFLWGGLRAQMDRFKRLSEFVDDARSGRLPPVCYVEPNFLGANAFDDHPPHDILQGQAFISTVLNAIAQGPQWSRSLVIITYDEHGGFFDHVAPPTVEDERSAEGFGQLGVRVPGLVISPYAKRGFVSPTMYDHCSVLAFLEWMFGLEPLNVRDAQANDLTDAIDVDRVRRRDPRAFPALPILEVDPDNPPECDALGIGPAALELAQAADAARIPAALDGRRDSAEQRRLINQALIEMGGARRKRR